MGGVERVKIQFSDHVHNFAPLNPTTARTALYASNTACINNPESTVQLNVAMLVIGEN